MGAVWEREIEAARCAALAAGHFLAVNRDLAHQAAGSAARDVKLKADQEAEAIILNILSRLAPHPVLAEEAGQLGDLSEKAPIWIVDPLDGTVNYSRGMDLCCISIALYEDWTPLMGVVYDFTRRELFMGVTGQGAHCNGQPIRPSAVRDPANAILATGFPVNRNFGAAPLQAFLSQVQSFKKIRLLGSAALSLAYTACGRVDAYMEEDIMFYDVAAGMAIAAAAGAWTRITQSRAKPWAVLAKAGRVWENPGSE
ncbi:MAG: inositol monophosphatase [Desulfatirhabdiaceae bacterium]